MLDWSRVHVDDSTRSLLGGPLKPADVLDRLEKEERLGDAVQVLAQLLGKRAGVWWACQCVWDAHRPNPAPKVNDAVAAAVRWVQDPCEESRKLAEKPAKAASLESSAGCLAEAVFRTAGSMTGPNSPMVAVPAELTGSLVAGAVALASIEKDPQAGPTVIRKFLSLGKEIASGKNRWDSRV